jgi:hypothetical protein
MKAVLIFVVIFIIIFAIFPNYEQVEYCVPSYSDPISEYSSMGRPYIGIPVCHDYIFFKSIRVINEIVTTRRIEPFCLTCDGNNYIPFLIKNIIFSLIGAGMTLIIYLISKVVIHKLSSQKLNKYR